MKKFIVCMLCIFSVGYASAQNFDFNPRCLNAYSLIQGLRFNEAKNLLTQEKKDNPQNLIPYYLENTIDFISIYINENEDEFDNLKENEDTRLEKIKSGNENSPYYLYLQAEILIQWAFARLKFGEYLTAFNEVKKAYNLLNENTEKFPSFYANKKSMGMLHAIVGAIPDEYKWGVKLLGMNGTVQQGLNELKSVIEYAKTHDFIFKQEAYLYYAFLALYLQKDDATAWNIVKDMDTKNNLLNCFCVASIAMRTGKNDLAINILQNRPGGSNYLKYPYLDFMLGLAKTRRLDSDASQYFLKFIRDFGGKNYIKEAYQKLAWNALLQNDISKYAEYMLACETNGDDVIDDDKQALLEAESGDAPNIILLRARLLFDGGYYQDALKQLDGKSTDSFTNEKDKVEFTYRAGRIYHESGLPEKAKGFYVATIKNGENLPEYFATAAALQLGLIYEKENNLDKSEYYYNKCLNLNPDEYKTSLHGMAKAGLGRIGK